MRLRDFFLKTVSVGLYKPRTYFEVAKVVEYDSDSKPMHTFHLMQSADGKRYVRVTSGGGPYALYCNMYLTSVSPWANGGVKLAETPYADGNPSAFASLGYKVVGKKHFFPEDADPWSAVFFEHPETRDRDICVQTFGAYIDFRNHNFFLEVGQKFVCKEIFTNDLGFFISEYNDDSYNEYGDEGEEWKPEGWRPGYGS